MDVLKPMSIRLQRTAVTRAVGDGTLGLFCEPFGDVVAVTAMLAVLAPSEPLDRSRLHPCLRREGRSRTSSN